MTIENINENAFDTAIAKGLAVTDFWATWCTPCKIQSPILEKVAAKLNSISFKKIDVDKNKDLATKFGVKAIPTLLITRDGKVVDRLVGVHNQKQLEEYLSKISD